MNADMRRKPMSSGIAVGIRWGQSDRITDAQRAASRLLDRDAPGPERLAELRRLLRDMIREYRAGHPRATYREALAGVLDYRSWHAFELLLIQPGEAEARLTRARRSVMSGGEKSAADLFGLAVKFDLDLFMTGHDRRQPVYPEQEEEEDKEESP